LIGTAVIAKPPDWHKRFFAHVDQSGECWLWTARLNASGYGTFKLRTQSVLAHRLAFAMGGAVVPEGYYLDHTCHVRHCVNPLHLRAVTRKQNAEHRAGPQANNALGVRGVYQDKRSGRYVAQVKHNGENIYLGRFDDLTAAADAAHQARVELFTHDDSDPYLTPEPQEQEPHDHN